LHGNDNDQILTIDDNDADEEDGHDDGDDDWHADPNRNSSEKRNRFRNANNHNLSKGEVNQNEHEMEIGIENQYANHGWDGDANANWKRNGDSHDRDIEDDCDNGDIYMGITMPGKDF